MEIDGLPFLKMVIFHGYVSHNQRVVTKNEGFSHWIHDLQIHLEDQVLDSSREDSPSFAGCRCKSGCRWNCSSTTQYPRLSLAIQAFRKPGQWDFGIWENL